MNESETRADHNDPDLASGALKPHMTDQQRQIERFRETLTHARFEGTLLWQVFGAFLIANAVLIGFLAQLLKSGTGGCNWGAWGASILGMILCVLWFACLLRNSKYFDFRMAQARDAEPEGWNLIADKGERFADGDRVSAGGTTHKQPPFAQFLRTRHASRFLIVVIGVFYFFVFIFTGPWYPK